MSRRTKVSSLSPLPKRQLRSNSASSELLPELDLSRKKKKKLLSDLSGNLNNGSSANPPLRISSSSSSRVAAVVVMCSMILKMISMMQI
jgi:hypothetical protein